MIPYGLLILATAVSAAALDEVSPWKHVPSSSSTYFEPAEEEAERRLFESRMYERINVREYGKFDMLDQNNGHIVRFGTTIVPSSLQVMLHIINSPILHGSIFDSLNIADSLPEEIAFIGIPLRLPHEGAAYKLVRALLENNVSKLKRYHTFRKRKATWPTYIDNEAAYTFLWRLMSRQVKIYRHTKPGDAEDLREQWAYCYRNEANEILRFKFLPCMNRNKHKQFATMLTQWSTSEIPVSDLYLKMLDKELSNLDRSRYPPEMFDNLGDVSRYIRGDSKKEAYLLTYLLDVPLLQPSLSIEESMDIEARNIARVTLRFTHALIARMLERHDIHAFKILRRRQKLWRVHGITNELYTIRSTLNGLLVSLDDSKDSMEVFSSKQTNEIEEILFESSKKFNPYWSMKNDILYRSSNLISLHEMRSLGLLFEPDVLLRKLMNMSGEIINFEELYEILHKLINMETKKKEYIKLKKEASCPVVNEHLDKVKEQYNSLPSRISKALVAKCRCLLVFLYTFGVPDRHGKLEFPFGWPRNIAKGLTYIPEGLGTSCGLCNSILGFLSGIGYPPVVENMYAWETPKSHAESAVYQMLVTSNRPRVRKHMEHFDKTLLSYVSGHYKEDDLSSLAVGYYLYSGMGNPSRLLDDATIRSGIERTPKAVGDNCIDALPFVIDAAKNAMHARVPIVPDETNEEYRSKRYVEFIKKLASMGDNDGLRVMGDFHYTGHEEGNINVDVTRAVEYWTMAANRGDITSAMTVASHLINVINRDEEEARQSANVFPVDSEDFNAATEGVGLHPGDMANLAKIAEGYLRMVANSSNQLAAAKARFNMTRYGIGQERDPVAAAMYLQEAADRGDVMSQMLMGHAYAGLLPDITPADGKNLFMALDYYRKGYKSGNAIATFNAAVLTLHGYDLKYNTSVERCKASFGLFQYVGRHGLMPSAIKVMSKRASYVGDEVGHVMMNLFLSEMGDPDAHVVAATHYRNNSNLCYIGNKEQTGDFSMEQQPRNLLNAIWAATQKEETMKPSPCYLLYARRSGYEPAGGSPLLYAEALMDDNPLEAVNWLMNAKLTNEPKAIYLYAEMLEAGHGINQDCSAAHSYFSVMSESKDFQTRMLGIICIQRSRLLWLLQSCHRQFYELFVSTTYDQPFAGRLLEEQYRPCWYPIPRFKVINEIGDIVNTYLFLALVAFATLVYLKMH